ncbi:MAG: PAS domain-containing protein [Aulosira sp. ZfuVER01]|nr:PAS domain-containing protein [Aulosira sp. ZfuVER01]MDZ7998222.1 PAS domain-containing protein [Aulosira sp. DedVER01a]MDZ8055466.1 PAS domain-containing protein [Aulosira sp. ZfuCHP01]
MSVSILRILNLPGWNCKMSYEGVSIVAPTKRDATDLAQSYGEALSETACKIKGKVRIQWRGCKQPIEFFGWMATEQAPTPSETAERILQSEGGLFCSQLYIPSQLLYRMVAAGENERPVSIVRQDTRKQIIVNQPMAEMLQTPPEIATQRIMTQFWLPEDLAELEQRLHNDRQFTWTYSAGLNERAWAILTTQFEAFEVEGIWYRQGTCLSTPQLVPIPPGVLEQA